MVFPQPGKQNGGRRMNALFEDVIERIYEEQDAVPTDEEDSRPD